MNNNNLGFIQIVFNFIFSVLDDTSLKFSLKNKIQFLFFNIVYRIIYDKVKLIPPLRALNKKQ